ncbi:hypothetical protein OH738_03410 [Streptomyces hirsutus]|uniref:Uncharacterized protein n=1 Tax=Streptomyces hirsutus TaxID=35620 RepID=A0ABZ1GZ61_9ACTN|nr:hypothetical protein [Streptomyces hirsutus]WSD10683.1 hypothetical protein OIE73_36605 [Streptomyces hirsutus]WTD15969.1 hypothetical protein OH738_03410 [Streptomyces hirsutus]
MAAAWKQDPALAGLALLDRPDLGAVERQLLGTRDRRPDGSVAREGSGACPLTDWWQHLTGAPAR